MSSVSIGPSSQAAAPNAAQTVATTASNANLGVNAATDQTSQAVSQNVQAAQANDTIGSAGREPSVTPAPGPGQGTQVDIYA